MLFVLLFILGFQKYENTLLLKADNSLRPKECNKVYWNWIWCNNNSILFSFLWKVSHSFAL